MAFYRLLLTIWVGVVGVAGLWRVLRGREGWQDLRERLGLVPAPTTAQPYIWLHAASNGELASARPLLTRLADEAPDVALLITTNSLTGRDMARGLGHAARLAPVDTARAARDLLEGARAHVTLESEIWPNRIVTAAAQGKPAILLGTRISAGGARLWARMPGLIGKVLADVRLIVPQDRASQARLSVLGAEPGRLTGPVDLKSYYVAPSRRLSPALDAACPEGLTWLAASTHEGEEEIVLDAHAALAHEMPGLTLILAPRHAGRGGDIARLLDRRDLDYQRRSKGITGRPAIILADTMGEMPLWYDRAFATFVGGSLVERGGHTPHEPLAHGSVVLHGPHLRNFAWAYARIDTATPGARVTGAPALAAALRRLRKPGERADWLARQRRALASGDAPRALDRVMALLTDDSGNRT